MFYNGITIDLEVAPNLSSLGVCMADWREPREVIEAAEEAAAGGDYTSAELLLREAAVLQENNLGPTDPNLANTLNNLGVVCEINKKPDDAEDFFRRAYAIATAVLAADHPFVLTSRKNLEDFCTARGKEIDVPDVPPDVNLVDERPAADSEAPPLEFPPYENVKQIVSRDWSRSLVIGGVIAVGLFLGFVVNVVWLRWNDEVRSTTATSSVAPATPASSSKAPRAKQSAKSLNASSTDAEAASKKLGTVASVPSTAAQLAESFSSAAQGAKSPTKTAKSLGATPNSVGTTASVPPPPLVAAAELCGRFSTRDWQCVPPRQPVRSGSLVFYTRLKSPAVTTVQHRWYRGDHLERSVDIHVRVNTKNGYRTYSRYAVDSKGGGNWRVELRTRDGAVLHEERFVVK